MYKVLTYSLLISCAADTLHPPSPLETPSDPA